ncbi:hypothetical protein ACFOEY_16695 [Paracandidimonas soli]
MFEAESRTWNMCGVIGAWNWIPFHVPGWDDDTKPGGKNSSKKNQEFIKP